jgi:tetratricopeptide (TPR) repeat protein
MELDHEEEEYNLSLKKFESMLRTNKVYFFDSEEFADIIIHYIDIGKITMARKALKLALDQHPNSVSVKLVQIEMYIYDDKLDIADRVLDEIMLVEPHNEEIYIQRANVFSKRDQHEKAIDQLKIALKYTDNEADVYGIMGMEYLFMDELENARFAFAKCLDDDIDDQIALYHVIYCYELLDQLDNGITFLDHFIDKNPYSEVAWHHKGRLLYQLKNYQEALVAFDYATLIDDDFTGAYMEKGKCFEKVRNYAEAIVCYHKTLTIDDPNSYVYLRLGKCYEKLKNNPEAINYYQKTVHEDPLLDKGWIAATDFYIKQKDFKKALKQLEKALEIDAENAAYWKRYATINNAFSDYTAVEFGFRKAIEFGDKKFDTWMQWVDSLIKIKDFDCAEASLLLASNSFPDHAAIEYRLAGLYFCNLNRAKQGAFHLHNALRGNFKLQSILFTLFPKISDLKAAKKIIEQYSSI